MAARLTAQRFADVPELEAALSDTTDTHVIFDGGGVLPASVGPHVKLLQESLLAMGYPLPEHGADATFGLETKTAVTMLQIDAGVQRRLDLPDRTELIDGKVGHETMEIFDTFDPGPTSGSFEAIEIGVAPTSVAFTESPDALFSGFDASTPPPSLIVGTRTRRRVQVELTPV